MGATTRELVSEVSAPNALPSAATGSAAAETEAIARAIGGGLVHALHEPPLRCRGSPRQRDCGSTPALTNRSRRCLGLTAALGNRSAPAAADLPRTCTAPLVYVYAFMDAAHAATLRQRSSATFFDPWHQHNQFLSEWALHRSLLASPLRTRDPERATFFFVPFYGRIAMAREGSTSSMQRTLVTALLDGLRGSRYWRRSAGRDHLFAVSSTRPLEA